MADPKTPPTPVEPDQVPDVTQDKPPTGGGSQPDLKGVEGVAPLPDDSTQHEDSELGAFLKDTPSERKPH